MRRRPKLDRPQERRSTKTTVSLDEGEIPGNFLSQEQTMFRINSTNEESTGYKVRLHDAPDGQNFEIFLNIRRRRTSPRK